PALYEYRPLVRGFVEARAERIASREDARLAVSELSRESAAAIFARAHAGARPSESEALARTVLMPLVVATAEACGGFDWADAATSLRLATAAAVAAGPVLFERLDWRPFGVRPMRPIAAFEPAGEAARLDRLRGQLAGDLLERLALADDDPGLGEALDRWEL